MALHDMGWEFCFREITFIVSLIETKQKIDQTKSKNNLITKKHNKPNQKTETKIKVTKGTHTYSERNKNPDVALSYMYG